MSKFTSKNKSLIAIVSDVDETIADLYLPAESEMVDALTELLSYGIRLLLITGQSIQNVESRVIDFIPFVFRRQIAIGHCSGAELWGYDLEGNRMNSPYYSVYRERMSAKTASAWRAAIAKLFDEFKLNALPTMPLADFQQKAGDDPWVVMYDDRGPQITIEFVNAYCMNLRQKISYSKRLGRSITNDDLRHEVKVRAEQLLRQAGVDVSPRLAGMFALDFALENVTKKNAVRAAFKEECEFSRDILRPTQENGECFQIWGDKFSVKDGTDWHMTVEMPPSAISISFRNENANEMPEGYKVRFWEGKERLHAGLLEYLTSELLPSLRAEVDKKGALCESMH
jgi:hypothetical protein